MAALTVTCQIINTEHGRWCSRCALPSGVIIDLALTTGPHLDLVTYTECLDCGDALAPEAA